MSLNLYQTTHSEVSNSYCFTTDKGIIYTVYFDDEYKIFPFVEEIDEHTIYMGFKINPKVVKYDRKPDPKIGLTIMAIVAGVLKDNKRAVLLYVCSPDEGLAAARARSFSNWFRNSPLKDFAVHKQRIIGDTHCGVLFRTKHPNVELVELCFSDFDASSKEEPIFNDDDDDQDDDTENLFDGY